MSLLDDIYGDDSRTVLQIALDQATPNRINSLGFITVAEHLIQRPAVIVVHAPQPITDGVHPVDPHA